MNMYNQKHKIKGHAMNITYMISIKRRKSDIHD